VTEHTSEPIIRVTAMPADANAYGDIFGGWLMSLMDNGAGLIAGVAVALNGCGVPVRSLTLRTPTLDDVYLHVTGSHFDDDTGPIDDESTRPRESL